jgi:hypothetical protein
VKQTFSRERKIKRAFLRVAQVLYGHWEEGSGADTRLFKTLIPDNYILAGSSVSGDVWREHVVPCVAIRDRCFELFEQNKSIEDVATFIEAHLKLAKISEERETLDYKLGLKDRMPKGWNWGGNIWARLKQARIVVASEVGQLNVETASPVPVEEKD